MTGCEPPDSDPGSAGNAELGIVEFRTTESEARLEVEGVDADGNVVASVRLRNGHVEVPEEQIVGDGRELTLTGAGVVAVHASLGHEPLRLTFPTDASLRVFVADAYVADHLAGWGVTFVELEAGPAPAADTPYAHNGSCAAFPQSCSGTGATSCCMQHDDAAGDQVQKGVCGNLSPKAFNERVCDTPGAGISACGPQGPSGCGVCWTVTYSSPNQYMTSFTDGKCRHTVPLTLTAVCPTSNSLGAILWEEGGVGVACGGVMTNSATYWYPYGEYGHVTWSQLTSGFVGWGGACSGTGICQGNPVSNTTVIGNFL